MAVIPGARIDITGASGSQGLLSPKESWKVYVLPRGGFAAQDSTGTLITFDSADVANRYAVNDWLQVGLDTAKIRQVSAVGGNSVAVTSSVNVAEDDRVHLIGTTQPTVTAGSASYVPATTVYEHDDDASDQIVNSLITTDANGVAVFFSEPTKYDLLIQDGDSTNQASVNEFPIGADGVSTEFAATFGDTVTINGNFGVTGTIDFNGPVTVGATLTVDGAFGVTGAAVFDGAVGVTGHLTAGSTLTVDGQAGFTGHAQFASTVAVDGAFGVTGAATFDSQVQATGNAAIDGAFGVTGAATFDGQVQATGNVAVDGNAGVTGTLTVDGNATLNGDLRAEAALRRATVPDLTVDGTGSIIITGWQHTLTPDGGVSGDTLSNINGGAIGSILILRAFDGNSTVQLTELGNISMSSATFDLDNEEDTIMLVNDGTGWLEISRSNNGT